MTGPQGWYILFHMSRRQPFLRSIGCQLYRLEDRRAVPCEDLVEWDEWFATADRRVAETWIDDVRISTVFLGLDHNFEPGGDPALFETMVFIAGEPNQMRRYFIWEETESGHSETVADIHAQMERNQVEAKEACQTLSARLAGTPKDIS